MNIIYIYFIYSAKKVHEISEENYILLDFTDLYLLKTLLLEICTNLPNTTNFTILFNENGADFILIIVFATTIV